MLNKGNRIIAEFDLNITTNELHYHDSWNRLMSVVDKIINHTIIPLASPYIARDIQNLKGQIFEALSTIKIEHVFKAVIDFINYYNLNK